MLNLHLIFIQILLVPRHHRKRYKTKTSLISSRHTPKTNTPVSVAARTLKTKMGKGLAKLFGERDEDIIALDDIRDLIK